MGDAKTYAVNDHLFRDISGLLNRSGVYLRCDVCGLTIAREETPEVELLRLLEKLPKCSGKYVTLDENVVKSIAKKRGCCGGNRE
jgi:hypothetical protein